MGENIYFKGGSVTSEYHILSNLWNVLVIGTQDFDCLIRSIFFCVISLARATNSLHLGFFNPA